MSRIQSFNDGVLISKGILEIIRAAKCIALTAPAGIITKERQATRYKVNMKIANVTLVDKRNKTFVDMGNHFDQSQQEQTAP